MNDLRPGVYFIYEGQPYEVLETHHLKMQQRRPTLQTKMRNLASGKVLERNFQQSDSFEEADVERQKVKFLYSHRDQYWFSAESNPGKRFELKREILGDMTKFMKPDTVMEAISFEGKIINAGLPVKMEFKVIEAPPAIRGNTAQGGVKQIKLETGATINVPLFINEGDIIRVNTQTGEYAERVGKN